MSSRLFERVRPAFALRLALWYAGLFMASASGLFALTYHLLARSLEERDHALVRETLQEYASQYAAGGLMGLRRLLDARQATGADADLFIRIVDRERDNILLTHPHGWAEIASPPLDSGLEVGLLKWSRMPNVSAAAPLELATLRFADGTWFQVGRSAEARLEILARFRHVLLTVLAVVLAVALTGGVVFTHSALRPLRDLNRVVSGIIETGQLSRRVPVAGSGDAFDDVAALVNSLLQRIETLVSAMRESIDNVAHDLRTPLTRLQVVLEQALDAKDDAEVRDGVADALEETERVTGTLNALMDVSEAEAGVMRLEGEDLSLAEAIESAVELYEDVSREKNIALTWSCPKELRVVADRRRLRQVFANLVDNAVKYTPRDGAVRITAERDGDGVKIAVADTGPGIASQDRDRIWDRLYRGDRSRSERGLGLGLSLVRAIVHAHGGTADVEPGADGGSVFTVRLPNGPRFAPTKGDRAP
jgi:signal transduction histidine kinase